MTYRTAEQGHTRACLAAALICAVENMRDAEAHMGPEYAEALDADFRHSVQRGDLLVWAEGYLADGTTTCHCPCESCGKPDSEGACANCRAAAEAVDTDDATDWEWARWERLAVLDWA